MHGNWTMFLDIQPNPLDVLIIDGDLYLENAVNEASITISANIIWIKAGMLKIGNHTEAFAKPCTIELRG